MNFFKSVLDKTWIGKTWNVLVSFVQYVKDYNTVSSVFYSNNFKDLLKRYLNLDVDKDWIGRLYGVINPAIDINGKLDVNNMIIEIDGDNTNNTEYLQMWSYRQMKMVGQLFNMNNLYTYIDMTFEHVGPINMDNYLIIFDLVARKEFAKSLKKWLKHTTVYIVVAIIALIILL